MSGPSSSGPIPTSGQDRAPEMAASGNVGTFHGLVQNAPFGIFVVDADFRIAEASRSARRTFGMEPLVGIDLSHALRTVWPEPFASEAIGHFRHTLATGESYVATDTVERRADRDAVEAYDWRIERILMPDGRFGVVCYFYDLSERQRIEAELRASEERFTAAFMQTPTFMAVLRGPDHVFEFANPTFLRLIGNRDVIGRTVAEALPEVAAQGYVEALDRVYRTGVAYTARGAKYVAQPEPGGATSEHFLDFVYQPITDASGSVSRIFVEGFDVTDRIRAEQLLHESEAHLAALFNQATVGIAETDGSGRFLLVNDRYCALVGRSREELLTLRKADVIHPEDLPVNLRLFERAMTTGQPFEITKRYLRPDGSAVWVRNHVSPIWQPGDAARSMLSVSVDITGQRKAEGELRELAQSLEERVRVATAERTDAQARLAQAQRMEALGQLAGGIAHDFNNIIQAVRGGAALIERRPDDPGQVRDLARRIIEAAERGASVTRRLLAFSRRGELRAEPVESATVLLEIREILAATLGAGITVHLRTASDLPSLFVDKGQLETVLVNLATNARDAMQGAGTITLSAARAEITQAGPARAAVSLRPGSYVCLSVADTGPGMIAEVLSRATEPFFTTKPVGQGTGLGLAMARGFAEQSGGALAIDSEPGRGTVVRLWLPIADGRTGTVNETGSETAPTARVASNRCLLLVDDDPIVREMLAGEMAAQGYTLLQAASGPEALALLDAGRAFDLVVSDLSMPVMDGLSVVQEMQRCRPGLPAILLTGYLSVAAEAALAARTDATITLLRKPIDARTLAECVAKLLAEKAPA